MAAAVPIGEQLAEGLQEKVNASVLAAAALLRSDLAEHYPTDFPKRLAATKKGGKKRNVSDWIARAEKKSGNLPLQSGADVYFALVYVSPAFARAFVAERPVAVAFERKVDRFTKRLSHAAKELWDRGAAPGPTPYDRDRLPGMAKAIDVGKAEFSAFSEARCFQRQQFGQRPDVMATYKRFHLPLRRAFEADHGMILEEYWCNNVPVGAVHTDGGVSGIRVHFDGQYDECLLEIFNRVKELNHKAKRFLPQDEYETLATSIYGLFTDLLSAIDDAAAEAKNKGKDPLKASRKIKQKPFLKRIKGLEAELDAGSARQGQRWYIFGAAVGSIGLALLLALAALLTHGQWEQLFQGAAFGTIGAFASVAFRIRRGKLKVDSQQGKQVVYRSAVLKPVAGAIFGGIVVALLLSGLPQITVPQSEPKRFYFLTVLAFIAGFSERFAPSLLQSTEERVATEAAPKSASQETAAVA